MSNVLSLTKVLLKTIGDNNFFSGSSKSIKVKTKKKVPLIFVLLILFASIGIPFGVAAYSLTSILKGAEMHTLLWYLILPLGTILIMTFSVINTISIFFLCAQL